MKYRNKFYKKRPREKQKGGLVIKVYNNNVEVALKKLKRKVKDSNLFIDLREREYYTKLSETKRQKRNLAKLRNYYAVQKEKEQNNY